MILEKRPRSEPRKSAVVACRMKRNHDDSSTRVKTAISQIVQQTKKIITLEK